MPESSDIIPRLQAVLCLIDGILEATHGQAFDHIRGNFLYERAVERTVELISEAEDVLPDAMLARYPDVDFTPVLTLADKLLDNDYRIQTDEMWKLITKQLPRLKAGIMTILADFGYSI